MANPLQADINKMFGERESRVAGQLCTPGAVNSWDGYQRLLAQLSQIREDRKAVQELLSKFFEDEGED